MKKPTKRRIRKDKNFQKFIQRNAEKIIHVQSNADIIRLRTGNPNRPVDILIHTLYTLPFRISIRTKTQGRKWETIQNPLTILHHTLQDRRGWEETIEKIFLSKDRSEEHTSELQSRENLVCRLLLEKKNKESDTHNHADHY